MIVNRDELIFINTNKKTENIHEIVLIDRFDFSESHISINLQDSIEDIDGINKNMEWDFDAEKIQFPLRLRKHQDGDEFYPTGFSGKKKVSKFFRDEKLSILARQKIWILSDSNNSVLGIIPFRQDRRYAKDEKTERILKIFNETKNEI
ncbi:tRNA lysidine(34) synthetase TilS [Chryseobacterium sp. CH25]|uniref:tRNA lysidine(34) synthetase TilS n=1 Tax=Chryseobacterium sp. CH25 TaxID=713559 RepID=UPI001E3AA123|nr:tRNA lysidine(34) synthetase TilS [Chryseobacterium sp. CH25]